MSEQGEMMIITEIYNPDTLAWQDNAECKDLPLEMFYYDHNERGAERSYRERTALAVCKGCPVTKQCLQDAIDRNDQHSIQGGTTPVQRGHKMRTFPEAPILKENLNAKAKAS